MIFAAGKLRLALVAAAGFMMVQVSETAGAQAASLDECQSLAEFFSKAPAFVTVDQLGILQNCVADYRAQRGGMPGETESHETDTESSGMSAGGFSGGTSTFKKVPTIPTGKLILPKILLQK